MRYAQGGGLTAEGRRRREQVRLAAVEKKFEHRVPVAEIAADLRVIGRRPVGNIRKVVKDGYRLRFRRHGEMRTSPEWFSTRQEAQRALWKMADDGAGRDDLPAQGASFATWAFVMRAGDGNRTRAVSLGTG
jgi:hypothetical protein